MQASFLISHILDLQYVHCIRLCGSAHCGVVDVPNCTMVSESKHRTVQIRIAHAADLGVESCSGGQDLKETPSIGSPPHNLFENTHR